MTADSVLEAPDPAINNDAVITTGTKRKRDSEIQESDVEAVSEAPSKAEKQKEERLKSLKGALLTSKRKYEIQDLDFGPDEKDDFQRAWLELDRDADARKKLDVETCESYLQELKYSKEEITREERMATQGPSSVINAYCVADIV